MTALMVFHVSGFLAMVILAAFIVSAAVMEGTDGQREGTEAESGRNERA